MEAVLTPSSIPIDPSLPAIALLLFLPPTLRRSSFPLRRSIIPTLERGSTAGTVRGKIDCRSIEVSLDRMYPERYSFLTDMKYKIHSTDHFNKWFQKLKDSTVKQKILARLARLENGNFGDFKQIDQNLFELRFFFAGGLRIYYTVKADRIILLLTGGNKSSQNKDIVKAEQLVNDLE
jgi:putative addiction module killer protein